MPNYLRALSPGTQRTLIAMRRELYSGSGHLGLTGMRTGATNHDGLNVHWYECGPESPEALTVLYVHGFNISSQSFYMQVRALQHLPVRQLLVDYRGHGRTAEQGAELSIDPAADDIIAVVRDRGITGPVIVVGHSLGGPVSLSLMRRYAGELNLAGSVQISSSVDPFTDRGMPQALGGTAGAALYRMVQALPILSESVRVVVTETLAPVLAVGFYAPGMSWEVIEFHAAMIQATPLDTYSGFFDDLRDHDEHAAADVLATIPGFILVGDIDTVTPVSQSRELHKLWPQAKFQVLPGSGHMPPLDAPGAVTTAIRRLVDPLIDESEEQAP